MSKNSFDIAVVGAGPAGLAAALSLEDGGYRVVLVGPLRSNEDERTSALLSGSIAFLERIGTWPDIEPLSAPLRILRIVDATGRLIRAPEVSFDSTEIGLEAFGYNIPNTALVSTLEAAVAQSGIHREITTAEDIVLEDGAIRLSLASGTTISVSLAVAADGRLSTTREAAGITTREWRYDQAALVVNLRHTRSHDDTSTEFQTATGPFTMVPLPDRRSSLVWVGSTLETEARIALSDEELSHAIEVQSASILGRTEIDGKRQVFPLAGMNATCFGHNRTALVGEAAHLFPPIGAQGLNLGYRDVTALSEILAGPLDDPGDPAVLKRFDSSRQLDVISRTAAVDALNRTLLSDLIPVQGIRSLGLFLLDRLPPLRRTIIRQGLAAESHL